MPVSNDSVKYYLIDGKFMYSPESHIFFSQDTERISLPFPASHCLYLLIQNKGKVVSQEMLMNYAWKRRGMNVSANTLYQNISILRKLFVEMGAKKEIIRTEPKRGFTIPDTVIITSVNELVATDNEVVPVKNVMVGNIKKYHFNLKKISMLYVALFFLCMALPWGAKISLFNTSGFGNWKMIQTESACHILRNSSNLEDADYLAQLEKKQTPCYPGEYTYVSAYPLSQRLSIMRCNRELNDKQAKEALYCESYYYREVNYYE